ncbi:MAG: right-handed parallel beta-helix repeat-containing protein [Verrucomicrobiaceae bacterium]|nr:right-handed parallel beta-helix repeat-containing protein [Verrucomicrobiaceae bacterium]
MPHGIAHHFCRLAIIKVQPNGDLALIEDCRPIFPPLTEIDDACGCCSKTVGTTAAADYGSIQEAINSLPDTGGQICVLDGAYRESVRIAGKRNITIIGCGRRTLLMPGSNDGVELGPIIQIEESANIRLELLSFLPELRSAVVVLESRDVTVCECEFVMFNPRASEPAIYFQAEEGLIERNSISAAVRRILLRDDLILNRRPIGGQPSPAHGASGIQLAGGCRRVRVLDNVISEVRGQGITLGNLEEVPMEGRPEILSVREARLKRQIVIGRWRDRDDDCDDCKGITSKVPPRFPPRPGRPPTKLVSPESLWDISIERNRIRGAGRDGIGVIGFFDLTEADEFVTVRRLTILGNEIADCLRLAPEPIEQDMIDSMGYGGIALADVSQLVIHDNAIENNGTRHNQPVCGIFVLHGEGIDIERNRILGNGFEEGTFFSLLGKRALSQGRRGGIQIVYALAPVVTTVSFGRLTALREIRLSPRKAEPTGFPALKIHDNIVSSPIGPALSAVALGPVSAAGNQLTSGRLIGDQRSSIFAPATVFIFNLGLSNEAYFQQAAFSAVGAQKPSPVDGLDDQRPGNRLVNGNILFVNNQCSLDLLESGNSVVYTSLLLASLDDIGFLDNQCDCNLTKREDLVATHAFLFGFSVRAIGNRFKEGLFDAVYSAITTGLINTTAHNQATHCLRVSGLPALTQDGPNTVLRSAHCRPEFRTTWTNLAAEKNKS